MTHKFLGDFIYLLINIGLHFENFVKVGLFYKIGRLSFFLPFLSVRRNCLIIDIILLCKLVFGWIIIIIKYFVRNYLPITLNLMCI